MLGWYRGWFVGRVVSVAVCHLCDVMMLLFCLLCDVMLLLFSVSCVMW